jgi:hypothetical protein
MLSPRLAAVLAVVASSAWAGRPPAGRVAAGGAHPSDDPVPVITRQVDAYNRHDLDGFLATYEDSCVLYTLGSPNALRGHEAVRDVMLPFFKSSPNLRSTTFKRVVFGPFVVDREQLSGIANAPPIVILSIYQVHDGRIVNFWQSQPHLPKPGTAPAPEPDPAAAVIEGQWVDAFNKHDVAATVAAYADVIRRYSLTRDTAAVPTTREQIREKLDAMSQGGAHPHITTKGLLFVDSYVVRQEHVTGLPSGQAIDRLVVSLVKNDHIVATWETP